MELTRRVVTNVAKAEATHAPMGQIVKMREYPERQLPRRHRAERRHALYDRLLRRRRRALGSERPRHEGALLPAAVPRRLDQRLRGPGKAHDGNRRADLRHHRAGLVGDRPRRHDGTQVADRHRLAARAHLLHRHARGLRRGPRASGRVQAPAAEHMGQGLCAARRQGRSGDRHEDGRQGPGQSPLDGAFFTLLAI